MLIIYYCPRLRNWDAVLAWTFTHCGLDPKTVKAFAFPLHKEKKAVDKMKVLHKFKSGDFTYTTKHITRSIAIHQFCIECMGWQTVVVLGCPSRHCVLYPYRMGPGKIDRTVEEDPETSFNPSPEGKKTSNLNDLCEV